MYKTVAHIPNNAVKGSTSDDGGSSKVLVFRIGLIHRLSCKMFRFDRLKWQAKERSLKHLAKFKEYNTWFTIGCGFNLKLPLFEEWLDEYPESRHPHTKFALFFEDCYTDERIAKFVAAVRERFPTQVCEVHKGISEEEMAAIIGFVEEFSGESSVVEQ